MEVKKLKFSSIEEALIYILTDICEDIRSKHKEETDDGGLYQAVNLQYIIREIAYKKGWSPVKTAKWLDDITELYPAAALNILLREIAVLLDKKYEDHINKSEKIFVISSVDGRIHKLCKAHIKSYKNFAAFRTLEDAKFACNILREQLKDMFHSNAKKE